MTEKIQFRLSSDLGLEDKVILCVYCFRSLQLFLHSVDFTVFLTAYWYQAAFRCANSLSC